MKYFIILFSAFLVSCANVSAKRTIASDDATFTIYSCSTIVTTSEKSIKNHRFNKTMLGLDDYSTYDMITLYLNKLLNENKIEIDQSSTKPIGNSRIQRLANDFITVADRKKFKVSCGITGGIPVSKLKN